MVATQEGVFHFNTFLELELSCPHFKVGGGGEGEEGGMSRGPYSHCRAGGPLRVTAWW